MCRSGNGGREVQVVKSSNIIIIDGDTARRVNLEQIRHRIEEGVIEQNLKMKTIVKSSTAATQSK